MCRKFFLLVIAVLLAAQGNLYAAAQSNFQVAPPPIAYPYFEPGRNDLKLTGSYLSIKATGITINGGGVNMDFRKAMGERLAFDGQLGLFGLFGTLPGFAIPFYYSGNLWTPVITNPSHLSGVTFPLSFNLEIQPLHRPGGSLLFFAGPNMTFSVMSITNIYYAVSPPSVGSVTTFTMDTNVLLVGAQGGVQGGINLGSAIKLAPFFMVNSQSGSASTTFDTGYNNVQSLVASSTSDIEPFTTTSMGMDIVIIPWNLSIGTMLQQAAATSKQEEYKTTLIQLSWHFRK